MGMAFLRGDETSREIIVLAYGMEDGLGGFYRGLAETTEDSQAAGVFAKLAGIEERHKERLFDLYLTLDPAVADREAFENSVVSGVMEGGFTTAEFLEQNRDVMNTVPDALNMAMMLEAQALDLYMRYSEKAEQGPSKSVLYDLAEEEKAHLAMLGRLMEERV